MGAKPNLGIIRNVSIMQSIKCFWKIFIILTSTSVGYYTKFWNWTVDLTSSLPQAFTRGRNFPGKTVLLGILSLLWSNLIASEWKEVLQSGRKCFILDVRAIYSFLGIKYIVMMCRRVFCCHEVRIFSCFKYREGSKKKYFAVV